jgi:hypothetical protein
MTGLHGLASLFPLTFHMHLIEKEYLSSALSALAQNPMIGLSYGSLDVGFRDTWVKNYAAVSWSDAEQAGKDVLLEIR